MSNAPDPNLSRPRMDEEAGQPSGAVVLGSADASAVTSLPPDQANVDRPDPSDEVLVDQAGRPLGPRALQTRRRILDAAVELLAEKPMRDMRVIDIARRIGSSPATFYQYFKDVEDVVLYLAGQAKEATPTLVELIGGDWHGASGYERGQRIVNLVLDHWEKYAPVLRARNNASDEGNMALRGERMAALLPVVDAFRRAIERTGEADGDALGRVDPLVGGTALASCLERTAMYHAWIEDMGSSREKLVDTTATLLQTMITRGY